MSFSIERMLPLLRCPRSGTELRCEGDYLISATGELYPIVDGKPVLVREIAPLHITRPDNNIVSRNIREFTAPPHLVADAVVVHLGCGDVPSFDPRVISIDILPTANANVVAEAECLPLQTGTIDYLESSAVFEHLWSPWQAAAEVRRVLKDGGYFRIDTAFLQGYHGFPSHYFNMTPQAAEAHLIDDFILAESYIPESATVLHTIVDLFDRFLGALPQHQAERLTLSSLGDVLGEMRIDTSHSNALLAATTSFTERALAASVVVAGRKPSGYDQAETGHFAAMRRSYYAARGGVILRHHEIEFYRMRAIERGAQDDGAKLPHLPSLLARSIVDEPLKPQSFETATAALAEIDTVLLGLRNRWIHEYLSREPREA